MRRWRISLFLLLSLALLAGCSGARFAYDNADSALRWVADDYFAFEDAQAQDFRARLARFHAWHRSEELPRYSELMQAAAAKLGDGLTREKLLWAWDSVKARYRALVAQAAPELAAVLATLTPAQFEHLRQRFAQSDREFAAEHLEGGEAAERKRREKRNLARMRDWFGDLTEAQETLIRSASAALPLTDSLRLQNRQRRQREFVALLLAHRTQAELAPELRRWLGDWEEGAAPEYLRASALQREGYLQMLLALDPGLTPAQRAHAAARLNEYGELFAALARPSKLARADAR